MQLTYWLCIAISVVAANSAGPCPRMEMCGSDGVTYGNLCTLTMAQIAKPDLKVVYSGRCGKPFEVFQPCLCTSILRPLCGNDGESFINNCEFDCAKKQFPNLEMIHEGFCDISDCEHDVQSVCGTNGRNHRNVCLLKHKQRQEPTLKVIYKGYCGKPEDEKKCHCNTEFLPVCGNDGRTYENKCAFDCAKKQFRNLENVRNGPCDNEIKHVVEPVIDW